jgi:NAD(P)-dependent dehydrogenase (short-subunit alcohol dehydrogenase family)
MTSGRHWRVMGHFAPTRHAAAHWRNRAKADEVVRGRHQHLQPTGVFGNAGQTNYGAAKAGIANFTIIAALELGRYGVTVNCVAPNARTRMTESAFELPDDGSDFDPIHPVNNTPMVVALCADAAQKITGQVFHVFGSAVNMLQPWAADELFARDTGWSADELLAELLARLPEGVAPVGLVEMLERVGGSHTPR